MTGFAFAPSAPPAVATLVPLRDGPSPLSAEERAHYARQITMKGIGVAGQERLKGARVLVVGAGGLGSPLIAYLARAGVGTIGVIDDDEVAASNLHRQIIHDVASIGLPKVDSAARAVAAANRFVDVIGHHERLVAGNARRILSDYDLVMDGTDDFGTRYLVADTTAQLGIPCVWGAVLETDGQLATFWSAAPGGGVTLRDIYPVEPPATDLSCATAGVLGPLCGVVASWMAAEAVKLIAGFGRSLLGRMLSIDAFDGTTTEIDVRPVTSAAPDVGRPVAVHAEPEWITVRELDELRRRGDAPSVLDVREESERALVSIPGSAHIPLGELASRLGGLPLGPLVVHCHHDARAQRAAAVLSDSGVTGVRVLRGGVDAWAEQIDPSLPRY